MNLDKLLADAMRHAHDLKHAGSRLQASIECSLIHREVQKRYGPQTWTPARLIEILWHDESGLQSSLGLFREMVHRTSDCRRLVRVESIAESETVFEEHVRGSHWTTPRAAITPETSVHEILELRERFEELMREVEYAT